MSDTASEHRTRADIAGDIAQLYVQHKPHREIAEVVNLTKAQVHNILTGLFADGMPKRKRHMMSDDQVRAIHTAYTAGDGEINELAEAIGFSGGAAYRRMQKMKLLVELESAPPRAARSPAHAEQREITALVVERVERLRAARGWSVERVAQASGLSLFTLLNLRKRLTDPRLSTLLGLCKGLGVTSAELLGDLPLPIQARRRNARPATTGVGT